MQQLNYFWNRIADKIQELLLLGLSFFGIVGGKLDIIQLGEVGQAVYWICLGVLAVIILIEKLSGRKVSGIIGNVVDRLRILIAINKVEKMANDEQYLEKKYDKIKETVEGGMQKVSEKIETVSEKVKTKRGKNFMNFLRFNKRVIITLLIQIGMAVFMFIEFFMNLNELSLEQKIIAAISYVVANLLVSWGIVGKGMVSTTTAELFEVIYKNYKMIKQQLSSELKETTKQFKQVQKEHKKQLKEQMRLAKLQEEQARVERKRKELEETIAKLKEKIEEFQNGTVELETEQETDTTKETTANVAQTANTAQAFVKKINQNKINI